MAMRDSLPGDLDNTRRLAHSWKCWSAPSNMPSSPAPRRRRSVIKQAANDKTWWQTTYHPGEEVPKSGIYRCLGCGREICSNKGDPFPPQNHHQHTTEQGKIRWKLNVSSAPDGH